MYLDRVLLTDSTQQLKSVSKKVGSRDIEKARPFFEAQEAAKKAQKECQAAATAYQRAFGVHAAAKVLQQTLEFATTDFEMQQRLLDFELWFWSTLNRVET